MAINRSTVTQRVVVPPTGTGSVYFVNENTPYAGLQITKEQGATTTQFLEMYYSNISRTEIPGAGGDEGMPVTSSNYPYVWSGPDTAFSASLFTASAPASQMYNIGNMGSRFANVRFGSITGGSFIVSWTRKD